VVSVEQEHFIREVYMDAKIENTFLILFCHSEKYKLADLKNQFWASPRGSINLANAAKCYAFIKRRGYVIPEDVRAVVHVCVIE
jgi:MoxR-like ATPase